MDSLNTDAIEELIACPKLILDPPKKEMQKKNRHFRNDMKLISEDKKHAFKVFMRINEEFPEDFSVGLLYISPEGKEFQLVRCNGPNGEFTEDYLEGTHHYGYHTHKLKEGYAIMKPELTDRFGTYQDAIAYFIKFCSISNAARYFKYLEKDFSNQLELWNDD